MGGYDTTAGSGGIPDFLPDWVDTGALRAHAGRRGNAEHAQSSVPSDARMGRATSTGGGAAPVASAARTTAPATKMRGAARSGTWRRTSNTASAATASRPHPEARASGNSKANSKATTNTNTSTSKSNSTIASTNSSNNANTSTNNKAARGSRNQNDTATRTVGAEPADDIRQAKATALRYLGSCARTTHQVRQTLEKRGYAPEVQLEVLTWLSDHGLVDDAAYAESWVRSRSGRKGLAPRALAVELQRKGVHTDDIAHGLEQFDAETSEAEVLELLERKLHGQNLSDQAHREKMQRRLFGMLQRKGHGAGTAQRLVRQAFERATQHDMQ